MLLPDSHSRRSELPRVPAMGPRPVQSAGAPRPAQRWTRERVVRWALMLAGLALAGWVMWLFSGLLIYLLLGVLLAYLVRPLVDRMQARGLQRNLSIVVAFVVVLGTISIFLTYLVPFLAEQASELSDEASGGAIMEAAASVEERLRAVGVPVQEGAVFEAATRAGQTLFDEQIAGTLVSMLDVFADIFYAILVIPFVTFFVLKDGTQLRRSLIQLVPNRYLELSLSISEKVERNVSRYFRALVVQCSSVGLVATILLWIVGLDYALAIGLFTGLANAIPYFGPLIGLVAGTLVGVAQTGDFSLLPGILIAMFLTQVADNVFFQPLIFSKAARTHPLVILFVVLVGAQLGGIVGMLVAIPLLTILRVAIEQILWSLRNYRILHAA